MSEFAGAAEQLDEAIRCNPFDVEGLSHLIENALDLDHDDRRERIAAMSATVHRYDVFTWVDQILADAKQAAVAARV